MLEDVGQNVPFIWMLIMTKSELFAINEWLSDYPKDATFDDILYMLCFKDDKRIVPLYFADHLSKNDLANCIANTETHFFSITR